MSNAYTNLIDVEKRAHYDRYGPEEEQPRPQYRQANANAQDYEYDQYDDLFRAFFGGVPMNGRPRGNVYTYFLLNSAIHSEETQGSKEEQRHGKAVSAST